MSFWKPIYFGFKKSKVGPQVTKNENVAGVGLCTPVSVDFSSFYSICGYICSFLLGCMAASDSSLLLYTE